MPAPRSAALLALTLALGALAPALAEAASNTPAAPALQELVVNVGTFPTSFEPGLARTDAERTLANALFAPLYRSPGGSTGRITPFLATGAPKITAGGTRYTVQLRAARWSDGTPVSAADVRTAFERARGSSPLRPELDAVRAAVVLGPRTVRFELTRPIPWFEELLASSALAPVPSHAIRRAPRTWATSPKVVTSGPFRLAKVRGRTELTLVRNARWWAASTVRLRTVVLRVVPVTAAEPLFEANRLDATLRDTSVPAHLMEQWRRDPRLRTVRSTSGRYLAINTANAELRSPAVRRGIALAVDRTALIQATSAGLDRPLTGVVTSGLRGSTGIVPDTGTLVSPSGTPDLPAARAELAAGGWQPGTRRLNLVYSLDEPAGSAVVDLLVRQLGEVGVAVVPHGLSGAEFRTSGSGAPPLPGAVDLVLHAAVTPVSDPARLLGQLTCASAAAGTNLPGFCDSAYDAAVAAASRPAPIAARIPALRSAEAMLTADGGLMPLVPLYEPVGDFLLQPWVRGYVHHPSGVADLERAWVTTDRPPSARVTR